MTDIKSWSEVDADNDAVSPDGWPEGMKRSEVNNSARENMRAIRKFYAAAEWVRVYETVGDAWTAAQNSTTSVILTPDDAQVTDITSRFPTGSRIKLTGGAEQLGFVTSASFVTPNTIVNVSIDDGAVVDISTTLIEIGVVRDLLKKTAYYPTGTTTGQTPPQVPTIDDLGDGATLDMGDGNNFDADKLDGQHLSQILSTVSAGSSANAVYNGEFMVWQRGLTVDSLATSGRIHVNDNGNYVADRWKLLTGNLSVTSNNLVDVFRVTTSLPTGFWSALQIDANGVAANDMAGIFQVLEGKDSAQFVGSTAASLGMWIKSTGTLSLARIMVLGWTGAEDGIAASSDPISNWNTAGSAGGPTFKASWTKIMDSSQITTSGTWTRFTIEGTDISAFTTVKNIGILVYTDDPTWAVTDTLSVTGVRFENGSTSNGYGHIDYDTELRRCQRYYNNTFDDGDDPRNAAGEHTGFQMQSANAVNANDDNLAGSYVYPTKMRTTPTSVKIYNSVNDTDDTWYDQNQDADQAQADITENITETRVNFSLQNSLKNRVFRAHIELDVEF